MRDSNYRLDLDDERLWDGERPVQISNKAFQLLRLFVGNPNRLLTKDVILDGVWSDVCVTEGLIKEYVHDLRQALDDDPKQPRFIETVHGRGYRFLGGVETGGPVATASAEAAAPARAHPRPPALAVLPFANLTGEDRWTRFCLGLSDDLVTDLARYPDLTVVANGAAAIDPAGNPAGDPDIRDIGRALGIGYALSGSVQASDSRLRVNVKLIQTADGRHIWANQYERALGEVFDIQSDIITQVASAIGGFSGQISHLERLRLGRKPPGDLEVYELYLLGHELESHFEKESTFRAFELMQRAVKLDPEFARAWLVLAWASWQIRLEGWSDDPRFYLELQHEAHERAAALDPLDPFAVVELAAVRAGKGDLNGASDALERALDLGRNQGDLLVVAANSIAIVLDDPDRAMQVLDSGLRRLAMPGDWQKISMARVTFFARDYERALEVAWQAPANLLTRLVEVLSLAQLGRAEELREAARTFREKHPNFNPRTFVETYPITGAAARDLLLESVEKAGLG